MSVVQANLESGVKSTCVQARIINVSTEPIDIVAPDPYRSVWIADENGKLYPRRQAVAYNNSRKTERFHPNEGVLATIDLFDYFDDICTEALVRVQFEIIGMSGIGFSVPVEGVVYLKIPSIEEKIAERKKLARPRGLPVQKYDVSKSTQFDLIKPDKS